MVERVSHGAARWATLVAVPLALLAGLGAFAALGGFAAGGTSSPRDSAARPSTAAPQATGPVTMAAPALSGRAAPTCRALVSRLPGALRDRNRRPVTAGAGQNAAYGDPPITLACGAPRPTVPATDLIYTLNGVCWHAATAPTGSVWTTVDREVPVRVTVPDRYDPPGQWVIDFSAPVTAAVPPARPEDIPTSCEP